MDPLLGQRCDGRRVNRTRAVTLTVAVLLALSGCSAVPDSQSPSTPTETPTDSLVEAGPGEHAHDIRVTNSLADDVAMTVTVERNGTEVFRDASTVPADSNAVLAGFNRMTLPEDDRTVTVTATDERNRSASVRVSIYDCLGDVEFFYGAEGDLQGTYSIC